MTRSWGPAAILGIVLGSCGQGPAPVAPVPVAAVTPDAVAADAVAEEPTPTEPLPAPTSGPFPLWTERIDETDALPCDGASTGGVHGRVVFRRGGSSGPTYPLPGARVEVVREPAAGTAPASTMTDRAGCFVVAGLVPGRHRVTVTYGRSNGTLPTEVRADGLSRIDGVLEVRDD